MLKVKDGGSWGGALAVDVAHRHAGCSYRAVVRASRRRHVARAPTIDYSAYNRALIDVHAANSIIIVVMIIAAIMLASTATSRGLRAFIGVAVLLRIASLLVRLWLARESSIPSFDVWLAPAMTLCLVVFNVALVVAIFTQTPDGTATLYGRLFFILFAIEIVSDLVECFHRIDAPWFSVAEPVAAIAELGIAIAYLAKVRAATTAKVQSTWISAAFLVGGGLCGVAGHGYDNMFGIVPFVCLAAGIVGSGILLARRN